MIGRSVASWRSRSPAVWGSISMTTYAPELWIAQSNRASSSVSATPNNRSTWSVSVRLDAVERMRVSALGDSSSERREPISISPVRPRIASRLAERWAMNQSALTATSAPKS